jgi:hypothetical protein
VHRFHHLKWAGVGDVNFGLFFTVWDRLLDTFVFDPTARFDSDVLGIAAEPDYPVGYRAQLVHPFRPYEPAPTDPPPPEWMNPHPTEPADTVDDGGSADARSSAELCPCGLAGSDDGRRRSSRTSRRYPRCWSQEGE